MSRARFLSLTLALTVLLVAALRTLLPTSTAGGDSEIYRELASHPFDPLTSYKNAIFQFRLLVPVVVWALPLPVDIGFHVVTVIGLVVGEVAVAALVRLLVGDRLAVLAAPTYVLSFVGFYGLLQFRMIDTATAGIFAGALLAAYAERVRAFTLLAVLATASKEHGVTLPVAWLAARFRRASTRQLVQETTLVAIPVVVTFLAVRAIAPREAPYGVGAIFGGWREGLEIQGEWGYPKVFLQVLL